MNKEFVDYKTALELKELGYDEPCMASRDMDNGKGLIQLPLYQQVFRWFREKYGLQHRPWSGKINTVFYGYDILNIDEQEFVINNSKNGGGDCDYDSYEEAEQACLDKLIELIKTLKIED